MPRHTPNLSRRRDLASAIKRAKPDDMLRLQDLARAWGVTKPRFVNVMNEIRMTLEFPEPLPGPKNCHLYPAKASLQRMLEWETRHDSEIHAKQDLTNRILGGRAETTSDEPLMTPRDIIDMAKARALLETMEREQGRLIPADDVSAKAGAAFSLMSDYLSNLVNHVDPNGRLPSDVRALIQQGGRETNQRIYAELRDLFDADSERSDPPSGGTGKPRARRKRQ